jgi:pantoate--beta-alanine ligase
VFPFQVIREPAEMRARTDDLRRDGYRIGVVPTMGALHEGHLSLLREARRRCDVLLITIFVNPTQFGPGEDLDRYPRQEAEDLENARAHGVDLAYCPTPDVMYPSGYQTFVEVEELSHGLCGAGRPGHFRGVATVVTKLLNVTQPHVAVFGQKDYQQLALLRRLVVDLDFGVEVVGAPIVREPDGLALSSRNRYLDPRQRQDALVLHRALQAAASDYQQGESSPVALRETMKSTVAAVAGVELEYAEVKDAVTLAELEEAGDQPVVFLIAARVGGTRLIDNMVVSRV